MPDAYAYPTNSSPSPQKITRIPPKEPENGTKPTLTASDMGNPPKISGLAGQETRSMVSLAVRDIRQEHGPGHYGLPAAAKAG